MQHKEPRSVVVLNAIGFLLLTGSSAFVLTKFQLYELFQIGGWCYYAVIVAIVAMGTVLMLEYNNKSSYMVKRCIWISLILGALLHWFGAYQWWKWELFFFTAIYFTPIGSTILWAEFLSKKYDLKAQLRFPQLSD